MDFSLGSLAPIAEVRRIRHFMGWLLGFALLFGVVELSAAVVLGSGRLAVSAAAMWGMAGLAVIARRLSERRPGAAALLIAYGLLMVTAVIAPVLRFGIPTLLLMPVLAVALAMPYVRGQRLRELLVASFAVELLVGTVGALAPADLQLPRALRLSIYVGSIGAAAFLVLLLLFQFSTRIRRVLDQAMAANAELVAARQREIAVQRRLALLAEAGELLGSSLEPAKVLEQLARTVIPSLGDQCVVDVVRPDGALERVAEVASDPEVQQLLERASCLSGRRWPAQPGAGGVPHRRGGIPAHSG